MTRIISVLVKDRTGDRLRRLQRGLCCAALAALAMMGLPAGARADDTEGCLMCHRYAGLTAVDPKTDHIRLYGVDPDYYRHELGPHVRLKCTDCHDREAVSTVPHKPVQPVDCTRQCHLRSPQRTEQLFSHSRIASMLKASVHDPGMTLAQSNRLLGSPLREGQSTCLLCHDEPRFLPPGHSWADSEAPIERCNVCHDESMGVDTRYFYRHVEARSASARNNQDTVRVCALCHANDAVRKQYELPDSIASYLNSFHGKATLLGSQETADCLDCHVGPMQNVHMVMRHADARAPTHPGRLEDTCRTPRCHPAAGARISSAAVHLDLATGRSVEWVIALLFIFLILFTFGPSVMLTALKMLHVVVGRHDPGDHDRAHRAERIVVQPRGRKLLERFNPHQRAQHWVLAITFATLVLTGFPMKFADRAWAAWLVNLIGGLTVARVVHRVAGVTLIVAMLYHIGYIIRTLVRSKRREGKSWFRAVYELPMMITFADLKQMGQMMAYLLFLRRTRPQFDRFNLEEKFEYIGVFWGTFLLGFTGALMWANAWTSQHFPGRLLTIATLVHTMEALLALLHVGVVHMISVIFAPGVFPISPAMFTGRTPTEEIAEAHGAMLARAEAAMGVGEHYDSPPSGGDRGSGAGGQAPPPDPQPPTPDPAKGGKEDSHG
ncbi:MAG: hypothetical protein BIFFINMI_03157 [Phycisphaerae bacterium]|nr:hypothetical protein [Phycisphaerae bacterium]